MRRTIKWMFALSDVVAWFLVIVCVVAAIAAPLAMPAYAKMTQNDNYVLSMVVKIVGLLCVAVGSYLLTKRNYKGILLVLFPSVAWLISGDVTLAAIYGLFILTVFGIPLSLSYRELVRSVQARN